MHDRLDHGVVGNQTIIALVAPDSAVEWLCFPRFDSPSIFGAILDKERGGHMAVRLHGSGALETSMRYVEGTNVLMTTLRRGADAVRIEDFCPWDGSGGPPEFIRRVVPIAGCPEVELILDARPDYGARRAEWIVDDGPGSDWRAQAAFHAAEPPDPEAPRSVFEVVSSLPPWTRRRLESEAWIRMSGPVGTRLQECSAALERTVAAWRAWTATLPQLPSWALRSALTLALHIYGGTGAIIAAATTSIPEAIGEPRNWDYRYAWIRDGSFAARALTRAGRPEAGARFLHFLQAALGQGPVQPLYRIDGTTNIPERELGHLRGFADTGPVRVGNAAAEQVQNDAYGQIVWLAHAVWQATGEPPEAERWLWLSGWIEEADGRALEPDAGVWEFRDRPGRYLFSALWCWVALARGSELAEAVGDDRAASWRARGAGLRDTILTRAREQGFLAQSLDAQDADASSLMAAMLGFLGGEDPMFVATIARCESELVENGLMKRYVALDDFGQTSSTFGLCTLWWADALRRSGQGEGAHAVLRRFLDYANPVGLFSEDIDPERGVLLGNFPQVYSHTALLELALDD